MTLLRQSGSSFTTPGCSIAVSWPMTAPFIAGGIVPGVLVLKPDFPENKEDWPFFWGQNEYVINLGASYIYLVHAAQDLLSRQ